MTIKIDPNSHSNFLLAAKEFCVAIEKRSKNRTISLCQHLYPLILQLTQFGSEIPGYPDLHRFKINRARRSHEWKALYTRLQKKFGKYDRYREVFDPFDKREKTPTYGSLADDLSDLYQDLKEGLRMWETATIERKRKILSNWRFQFEIHWGEHATSAIRALYFILFRMVDGKDGLPVGLYKSAKLQRK